MLECKPKAKRSKDKIVPTSKGAFRDDPPNYDKPIYDKDGNKVGVIYDYPQMPGPGGLS